MASPARRWKNDCRTSPADDGPPLQDGLLAHQPAAADARTSAGRWRGRATAYRPSPSGTPSTRSARPTASEPPPARRSPCATTPAAVTSSPARIARTIRRRRAAGGCGDERTGVVDQPAGQRPRLGARAERQQLPATGGVAQAGDQRAHPGGAAPVACRRPRTIVQPRIRSISSSVCRRVISPRTAISDPPRRISRKPQFTTAAPTTDPSEQQEQRDDDDEHGEHRQSAEAGSVDVRPQAARAVRRRGGRARRPRPGGTAR